MSEITEFWKLFIPPKGSFPGSWDEKLNSNFEEIDRILKSIYTNNPGLTQPQNADSGSTWFDTSKNLLKILSINGFEPVVKHTHNGTIEGVPKINLATDVQGKILPQNVETVGLDADMIDGFHVNDLPSRLAGSGLEEDASSPTNKKLRLRSIVTAGIYPIATVDQFGRITGTPPRDAITNMWKLADFQIGDVYTKGQTDTGFAFKSHTHSEYSENNHTHNDYHALLGGSATNNFLVANPTADNHAVNRIWAIQNFANIAGSAAQAFSAAAIPNAANPDTVNHAARVVTLSFAEARYSKVGHTHDLSGNLAGYIKADGSVQMTGELLLNTQGEPVSNNAAASKKFVLDSVLAGGGDFAHKNGSIANLFLVAKAPTNIDPNWQNYALNKLRTDELYSPLGHMHAGTYLTAAEIDTKIESFYYEQENATGGWQVKNSNYTVEETAEIFADTSAGSFTITLPASPVIGSMVHIVDLAGTFEANNLTVARNGEKIMGEAEDMIIDVNYASAKFVYSNSMHGWRLV